MPPHSVFPQLLPLALAMPLKIGPRFAETARIMDPVRLLPLAILEAREAVTTRAARLKAGNGLPYAGCFAAATAAKDDVVVTSHAKDFRKIPGLHVLRLPEPKTKK